MCNKYDNLLEMSKLMSKEEKGRLVRQILQNFSIGMQADDQRKIMHSAPKIANSITDFTDVLPKMMMGDMSSEDKKDIMRRLMEKVGADVATESKK